LSRHRSQGFTLFNPPVYQIDSSLVTPEPQTALKCFLSVEQLHTPPFSSALGVPLCSGKMYPILLSNSPVLGPPHQWRPPSLDPYQRTLIGWGLHVSQAVGLMLGKRNISSWLFEDLFQLRQSVLCTCRSAAVLHAQRFTFCLPGDIPGLAYIAHSHRIDAVISCRALSPLLLTHMFTYSPRVTCCVAAFSLSACSSNCAEYSSSSIVRTMYNIYPG
jgi:hypothetical protein